MDEVTDRVGFFDFNRFDRRDCLRNHPAMMPKPVRGLYTQWRGSLTLVHLLACKRQHRLFSAAAARDTDCDYAVNFLQLDYC